MLSIREFLPHCCPACTCLTCSTGVDRLQPATSIFGFVRKFRKEGGPRHIVYRLGKHSTRQASNVQIFDTKQSEVLDQPERELVLKLIPLVLDSLVNLLQQLNSLAAAVRAFLASSNFTLSTAQFRFRLLIPTRVRHRLVVGHRDELRQHQYQFHSGWLAVASRRIRQKSMRTTCHTLA